MENLRQCQNSMTAVGTLKSKDVKYGSTKNGDPYIAVDLKVVSNFGDKIHENKIQLWAKNTSKLYNSYKTVAEEYKTIDEHGAENASRVKVTGSIEMNEYFNSNKGELVSFNNLKGVFVNRLDQDMQDEVGAIVEGVITGIMDEVDKTTGAPTGRKKVELLTVGYQSTITEIQNVYVEKELAAQFVQMYPVNSTGRLYLKVLNYVEVDETQTQQTPQVGFGSALTNMPDTTIKNYTNEIIIVGGDVPNVANKFTTEQINEMKKQRELAKQEKLNSAPATPPAQPSGFGSGFGNTGFGQSSTLSDGDMPF